MSMVYSCDFGEMFGFCTVLLHIFETRIAKDLSSQRTSLESSGLRHDFIALIQRGSMFRKLVLQRP